MNHPEAELHLKFCKWVKKEYPNFQFIRHEREKERSLFLQNLMKVYNTDNDKMPDFELLEPVISQKSNWSDGNIWFHRLYIEFKAPGTILTLRDGITIKPAYSNQYRRHIAFWKQNSPAYFCNDLERAKELLIAYANGNPIPMQVFTFPVDNTEVSADNFFSSHGL